ncbi:MAG TPA: sugar ABC transporter permease [Actinocatenispora sp.]
MTTVQEVPTGQTVPVVETTRRRRRLAGYAFLSPWFVGFAALTVGPMLASLYLSFTDYPILSPPKWVGLANYQRLLTDDPRFLSSLKVTFTYVVVSVPLSVVVALLVSVLLNRGVRGGGAYRSAFYLPSLLGGSVAVAILWRQVFGRTGLVNWLLGLFGLHGPDWVSDPRTALGTLILLHVWQFGAPMVIFLAALRQQPRELYEQAAIDGAGPVRRFTHLTLPLLSPVILFNLLLSMINGFQAFTPAYVVSGGTGGVSDSSLFYTLYLYQQGFTNFRMGYASAMAWVLFAIIAVFAALTFSTSKFWVHYGDER